MPHSPENLIYSVEYHRFTQTIRNKDFKGRGTLTISADGETFLFEGKKATLLGPKTDLELGREDISNVRKLKDQISFQASKGENKRDKKPFTFFCKSEQQATQLLELLPTTATAAFSEDTTRIELLDIQCPPIEFHKSPTNILIAINGLVFILMATFAGAGWVDPAIEPYVTFGASNGAYTTNGEWWRLLTNIFLHFGIVHVLMNSWVLAGAGHLLERLVGKSLFYILYFSTGIFASLASIIWYKDTVWSAGASGAVFGIYGALLAISLRSKKSLPYSIFAPLRKGAFIFIGYNLFYGAIHAGIDNAAHIGGLISGLLLGTLAATPIGILDRIKLLLANTRRTFGGAIALLTIAFFLTPNFDYNPYDEEAFVSQWINFGEK